MIMKREINSVSRSEPVIKFGMDKNGSDVLIYLECHDWVTEDTEISSDLMCYFAPKSKNTEVFVVNVW